MSAERFSLDANIFFYAIDVNDPQRHRIAVEVIERAGLEFDCIVASQAFALDLKLAVLLALRDAERLASGDEAFAFGPPGGGQIRPRSELAGSSSGRGRPRAIRSWPRPRASMAPIWPPATGGPKPRSACAPHCEPGSDPRQRRPTGAPGPSSSRNLGRAPTVNHSLPIRSGVSVPSRRPKAMPRDAHLIRWYMLRPRVFWLPRFCGLAVCGGLRRLDEDGAFDEHSDDFD